MRLAEAQRKALTLRQRRCWVQTHFQARHQPHQQPHQQNRQSCHTHQTRLDRQRCPPDRFGHLCRLDRLGHLGRLDRQAQGLESRSY